MTDKPAAVTEALDLGKLTEIAEAATPGPWLDTIDAVKPMANGVRTAVVWSPCPRTPPSSDRHKQWRLDAAFIATFDPPTVLRLLARLREVESQAEPLTPPADLIACLLTLKGYPDRAVEHLALAAIARLREVEGAVSRADSELSMIQRCLAGIAQDFDQFNSASKKLGSNAIRALTSIQDRIALGITRCTEDARAALSNSPPIGGGPRK